MGVGVGTGAWDQPEIHCLPGRPGETGGKKCPRDKLWILPHSGCGGEKYIR